MWDEPAGLTYLEAMACGVPVVAMARGGAEEYLVDEENALLVRARTRDEAGSEMADKVRALANDPTRAARLIAGGELTLRHASLEGYVEAIEAMAIEAARARSNARATSATNATRTRLARPLLKVTT
jgi:glycosyltransferase involved in cell wall biosynthesis